MHHLVRLRRPDHKEQPLTPAEQHAAAIDELDNISIAIARGVPVAPDIVMRLVIATRERLIRHRPSQVGRCAACERSMPCPEIQGDLKAIGVLGRDPKRATGEEFAREAQ